MILKKKKQNLKLSNDCAMVDWARLYPRLEKLNIWDVEQVAIHSTPTRPWFSCMGTHAIAISKIFQEFGGHV